jgi:hypothetical protein
MNTHWQPRATRYKMLAMLWLLPSLGAVFVFANSPKPWLRSNSIGEGLAAVRFEEWAALVLLLAHVFFVGKAFRHRDEPAAELPPEKLDAADEPPAS